MTQDPTATALVPTSSPLLEADPASLNELFNRDPLLLSNRDIELIVAEQRAQRARYMTSQAAGKQSKALKEPKGALAKATDLSLEDLGL